MGEPTKFTVSRADAITGEIGATYTYGRQETARARFDFMVSEGADFTKPRRIKLTAWGDGAPPEVIAERVLTERHP